MGCIIGPPKNSPSSRDFDCLLGRWSIDGRGYCEKSYEKEDFGRTGNLSARAAFNAWKLLEKERFITKTPATSTSINIENVQVAFRRGQGPFQGRRAPHDDGQNRRLIVSSNPFKYGPVDPNAIKDDRNLQCDRTSPGIGAANVMRSCRRGMSPTRQRICYVLYLLMTERWHGSTEWQSNFTYRTEMPWPFAPATRGADFDLCQTVD